MKYAMLIDTTRCSICFSCQVACKDEFVGNKYPPYSCPQPDVEQEWIKLEEIEKGKFPYAKVYAIPILCMHCEKPGCIEACPVTGAIYKTRHGATIIDPVKCKPEKCRTKPCLKGCPYQVIFFNNDSNIAQKCTLCLHRLDGGQEPACVNACPSNVFIFGEESKIAKEAKQRGANCLHPEYKTKPRLYYIGLPSVTLAGHIIDSKTFMDVPGATVTIENKRRGATKSTKSDISGNFSFPDLESNKKYALKIEQRGYKPIIIDNVTTDIEYQHLGEIKLAKASKK